MNNQEEPVQIIVQGLDDEESNEKQIDSYQFDTDKSQTQKELEMSQEQLKQANSTRDVQQEYNSIQVAIEQENNMDLPEEEAKRSVLSDLRQSFKNKFSKQPSSDSRPGSDTSIKKQSSLGRDRKNSGEHVARHPFKLNFGETALGQNRISLAGMVGDRVEKQNQQTKRNSEGSGKDYKGNVGPIQTPFSLNIPSSHKQQNTNELQSSAEKGHIPEGLDGQALDKIIPKKIGISPFSLTANLENAKVGIRQAIMSHPILISKGDNQHIYASNDELSCDNIKISLNSEQTNAHEDNPQEHDFEIQNNSNQQSKSLSLGSVIDAENGDQYQIVRSLSSRQSMVSKVPDNSNRSMENQKEEPMTFSQKKILPEGIEEKWIQIFLYVMFFANLFVNIDMGILPAGSSKIIDELNLTNTDFGVLGSVVYLGQTIGSAMATGMLQSCNPKYILGTCLFLNIGTLLIFTQTKIYVLLIFCRMCTGLFQVFFAIYFPVWADVYGDEKQKSTWLTYLLIASPLGVIMGYGMSAVFLDTKYGWRMAFYIQSIMLLPSLIGIILTPMQYIDIQNTVKEIKLMKKKDSARRKSEMQNNLIESPLKLRKELNKNDKVKQIELLNLKQAEAEDESNSNSKVIEEDVNIMAEGAIEIGTKAMDMNPQPIPMDVKIDNEDIEKGDDDGEEFDIETGGDSDDDLSDIDQTFIQRIKCVLTNPYFLLLCISLTGLYYIITGIQYWVTDYLIYELGVDETKVFISFSAISITGPVFGVIVGGNITTCLGGYNSEKAMKLTCLVACGCLMFSGPTPWFNDFNAFATCLWFLLFCGGGILPCITGIMLNTVDQSQKTTANSLANLSYNLLGYLPAPFVYGAIKDAFGPRWAMIGLMFSPIVSVSCMLGGGYLIWRDNVLGYRPNDKILGGPNKYIKRMK